MRKFFERKIGGFTLIELMIVVSIIGILAAVAIPAFLKFIKRSKTTEALENLRKLYDSSIGYYDADHTTDTGTIITPQFPSGETPALGLESDQPDSDSVEGHPQSRSVADTTHAEVNNYLTDSIAETVDEDDGDDDDEDDDEDDEEDDGDDDEDDEDKEAKFKKLKKRIPEQDRRSRKMREPVKGLSTPRGRGY
ncbi:MAG: pilin [Candidatus Omnitrophica bacterium]|nr:pilin [Candidatus Omnitrophota bacterium]